MSDTINVHGILPEALRAHCSQASLSLRAPEVSNLNARMGIRLTLGIDSQGAGRLLYRKLS